MIDLLKPYIINLRRGINPEENWTSFKSLVEKNIKQICESVDTRWLISICDTYVDYGNDIECRNALSIVTIINMEKLAQTNSLLFKKEINTDNESVLKQGELIDLWDGVTSFNIISGDLTNNMFLRFEKKLKPTPALHSIFVALMARLKKNKNSILVNLNKYHGNIFNYRKMKKYQYTFNYMYNRIMRLFNSL